MTAINDISTAAMAFNAIIPMSNSRAFDDDYAAAFFVAGYATSMIHVLIAISAFPSS